MQILVATTNPGKQREVKEILTHFDLVLPQDVAAVQDLSVNETGATFEENAFLKAQCFAQKSGLPAIADDSGICVDALNGFPGVQSARWHPGQSRERVQALLDKIRNETNRSARFVSVICLYDPSNKEAQYFTGEVTGTLSTELRGSGGFDYDYIFIPTGQTKTYAELGSAFKNESSHRKLALEKLKTYLSTK